MPFISTRGGGAPVSLRTALVDGLAPDGGLYVPASIEPLPAPRIAGLRGAPLAEIGATIASHLAGDEIPIDSWRALIADALDFEIPLVPVHDDVLALELFHGPTLAFKDVGARVLARLLAHFHNEGDDLTVLVATSGDTGGAVAHAFFGVPGTRVLVLYPDGQVSPVQEAQFATLGGNVRALAVQGTFDDCQRLVKEAFSDRALHSRWRLTSANSINVGRLLPQIFYYAQMALRMPEGGRPLVAVPSGNFGNLTAGLIAQRLGFPIGSFVAATNINDTIPRFLATGHYEPAPSRTTVANAMDVGDPSNFERIRWLFGDDLGRMQHAMASSVHTDAEVKAAIAELFTSRGYLCDPHGAVAYLGVKAATVSGSPRVFLATAHPAKFREVVEPVIGTAVPLPPALAGALDKPLLNGRIRARLGDVVDALTS
jgi:threonine synthase